MIKLINITKKFKTQENEITIYKNLNFEVKKGDFIAVIGKSGTGKSTLLNIISGLIGYESGDVEIGKTAYSKLNNDQITKFRGKNISFIFQSFQLIANLNVEENIELPIDINNCKTRFEINEIIKKVGLEEKIKSYPYELSGGEQQRVAIARAFLPNTKILLADEPTGNLDEQNSKNIMDLLLKLHSETKNTIIMITHDKNIAKYADKIYELSNKELKLKK